MTNPFLYGGKVMKKILGLLMMMGLMVSFGGFVGCGKDSPTGASEEITEGPQGQTLEVSEQEIKIYTTKQGREVTKEEYDKMLLELPLFDGQWLSHPPAFKFGGAEIA